MINSERVEGEKGVRPKAAKVHPVTTSLDFAADEMMFELEKNFKFGDDKS